MVKTRQITPQTKEEKLRKKREAEKRRYERLKQDPVGREKLREKEAIQYLKKKEKKVIRPINELCERAQRQKRKQWREYSQIYRNKKKQEQTKNANLLARLHEDPPPASEEEQDNQDRNEIPENVCRRSANKRYVRNRKKRSRENKRKMDLIKKLQLKVQKYKQKYYRMKKLKTKTDPPTPRTRVKQLIANTEKKNVVAKKLLFGEVISDQLKSNYASLKGAKEKQMFKRVVSGQIIKKYRVENNLRVFFRGSNVPTISDTGNTILNYHRKASYMNQVSQKRSNIRRFLENDYNSKLCPGKKDYRTKNKVIKQKRYLNDTLKNLHKKFLIAHPEIPVSYAFWCKNRPFWIVSRKVAARDTCGCTPCLNMTLLVQTLHRMNVIKQVDANVVIKILCCEHKNEQCLLRECVDCKGKKIIFEPYDEAILAHFFKWGAKKETFFDKKTQKEKCVVKTTKQKFIRPISYIISEFEGSIDNFLKHKGRALHQYNQISSKKATLQQNEVLLHMDFSENYSLKYSEETQSYHFGGSRQQISLHTVVIYYKYQQTIKSKSFCTLSEALQHDVPAIWAHLNPVLTFILETLKADTLFFLSDSPATQYRNKTMFYFLAAKLHKLYPLIKAFSWNYSESGHGKGAPDGIGGVTKRTADRLVAEGKDIASFDTLLESLEQNITNVTYFSIKKEDIENINTLIEKEKIKPFVGTMKVHQVTMDDYATGVLRFLSLSCFDVQDDKYLLGTLNYAHGKEPVQCELSSESEHEYTNSFKQGNSKKIRYEDVYNSDEEEEIFS